MTVVVALPCLGSNEHRPSSSGSSSAGSAGAPPAPRARAPGGAQALLQQGAGSLEPGRGRRRRLQQLARLAVGEHGDVVVLARRGGALAGDLHVVVEVGDLGGEPVHERVERRGAGSRRRRRAGPRARPAPRDHRRDDHDPAAQQQDARAARPRPRTTPAPSEPGSPDTEPERRSGREPLGDRDRPGHRVLAQRRALAVEGAPGRRRSRRPEAIRRLPGDSTRMSPWKASVPRSESAYPWASAGLVRSTTYFTGGATPGEGGRRVLQLRAADRPTVTHPARPPRPTTRRRRGRPGRAAGPAAARIAAAARTSAVRARSRVIAANLPGGRGRHNRDTRRRPCRDGSLRHSRPVSVAREPTRATRGNGVSFFSRLKAIFQAKANKALDAAENPHEMLDLSFEKQTELLTQVRRGVADVATSKKRLELQADKLQASVDNLEAPGRGRAPGRARGPRPHGARAQGRRPGPAREHPGPEGPAPGRAGQARLRRAEADGEDRVVPRPQGDHQGAVHRRRGADQDRRGLQRHQRGHGRRRHGHGPRREQGARRCRRAPARSTSCSSRARSTTSRWAATSSTASWRRSPRRARSRPISRASRAQLGPGSAPAGQIPGGTS